MTFDSTPSADLASATEHAPRRQLHPDDGWRAWTEAEIAILREHYPTTHSAVLAEIFGCSVHRVHAKATQMGLRKSIETIAAIARQRTGEDHPSRKHRFLKGNVPANKGLRRPGFAPGRMASTQFKKGQPPHTWKPLGSVRVNADGYLDRKVSDLPGPPHRRARTGGDACRTSTACALPPNSPPRASSGTPARTSRKRATSPPGGSCPTPRSSTPRR